MAVDDDGRPYDPGTFIRMQRSLARLSLRQLSELSNISNAYLSQVGRGRRPGS